jgi:hypothetical protein
MNTRANVGFAMFLIILGVWFLLVQVSPVFRAFAYDERTWPLSVVGAGALLGLLALLTWTPGMMPAASVVAGIGGLLYWQNSTGNWASWAYAWAAIPGFGGIGTVLAGLMGSNRRMIISGGWTIFGSLVLLAIFGSFLGGQELIQYWPLLLIALGALLLAQSLHRRR